MKIVCPGRCLVGALLALTFGGCSDVTAPAPSFPDATALSRWDPGSGDEPFKVYTQNAYLGGDTGPLFALDFNDLAAVVAATNTFWSQVTTSDVPGRAAAVAEQIDRARPHLVALEEVFRFEVVTFTPTPVVTATIDLLDEIEDALADRGLPYTVVRVQQNTTLGYPPFDAVPGLPLSAASVLRFQDRIAVLRRNDVPVDALASGNYAADFTVGPLRLRRGWIRASTSVDGAPHHLIATHLEGQTLAPIQAAQASELLNSIAAGLAGVTLLAGDFNSDAANPGAPSWTPTYDLLTGAGFTDAWTTSRGDGRTGYTCCQDPDLQNAASELAQRIDFVLVRDARASGDAASGAVWADVVGEEQDDRTEGSGLWPSDHAGLVAGLRLAVGLTVGGS